MNYGTEEEKEKIKDKMQIGVFQDIQKPGFFEEYEKLVMKIQEKKIKGGGGEEMKKEIRICGFGRLIVLQTMP